MKYRTIPGRIHQWHNQPSCLNWPHSGYMEHDIPEEKQICQNCPSITNFKTAAAKEKTDKHAHNATAHNFSKSHPAGVAAQRSAWLT